MRVNSFNFSNFFRQDKGTEIGVVVSFLGNDRYKVKVSNGHITAISSLSLKIKDKVLLLNTKEGWQILSVKSGKTLSQKRVQVDG